MSGLTVWWPGHSEDWVVQVGSWNISFGWKVSCPLRIHCQKLADMDGDHGLSCDCRGPWVLKGAQTLHVILRDLPGSSCYHSCGGPWCIFSLVWMLRETDRLVRRYFPLVSIFLTWAGWAQASGISSFYGAVMISGLLWRFSCYWQICPLEVQIFFRICLRTMADVNPGNLALKTLSFSWIQVDGNGLHVSWCRKSTKSFFCRFIHGVGAYFGGAGKRCG